MLRPPSLARLVCVALFLCLSTIPAPARAAAWLGFLEGPATPTPNLANVAEAAARREVRLVLPGSPAEAAGLKRGDVLLEMGGIQVVDRKAFGAALDSLKVGQAVQVAVWRGQKRVEVTATAEGLPDPQALLETVRGMGEAGSPGAFTALGWLLGGGNYGVARNEAEAARWLRKAADQGDAVGQHALSLLYNYGRGVTKDDVQSARWLRRAAEQGYAPAQYDLGVMYENGSGVTKDDGQAVRWYTEAAEQGSAPAQRVLGDMYRNGQGVPKNDAEAVRWYRKAAQQGDDNAQNNLAGMYAHGAGVAKDDAEAAGWYRRAAEQGNTTAQINLGAMYATGRGVAKDEAEALHWYRRAADQGDPLARIMLEKLSCAGEMPPK